MPKVKRVVAALDLPPRIAHKKTIESFKAAADRWNAKLLWIRKPLHRCHPFWQKLMVCRHVINTVGQCHLLQLDTDMLIRDDCPSPFEMASKDQIGIVAGRQGIFGNLGKTSWAHRAHSIWAKQLKTKAAPPWAHPNGGLYLYHTEVFADFFDEIAAKGPSANFDKRFGCDETIVINHLWDKCQSRIKYLPGEYNTLLHHNPHLCEHRAMQTYVYHFVGGTKRYLPKVWWKRGKNPAQPIGSGKHAQVVYDLLRAADGPMNKGVEVGVFHGSTAANLLALMPDLQLYGVDPWATYESDSEQSRPDHVQQISDTQTLHWGLPIALRTLGVNARRWYPIRLPSVQAAHCFEDGELDFVFIDGEHSYEAAKADIETWWPKVRSGGILMGHDYDRQRFPGVCRAVDEFAQSKQARIIRAGHSVWAIEIYPAGIRKT